MLLLLTVASIPYSVKLYARTIDLEVIFPAEPLIATVAVLAIWRGARLPVAAWRPMLRDPVVLAVCAFVGASLVSTVTSTMPMASLKALVVRLAYVVAFFFAPLVMVGPVRRTRRYLLLHAWLLLPVALWTMAAQVEGGFDRASAGFVSYPFYIDRTIYAAALSFGAIALLVEGAVPRVQPNERGRGALHLVGGLILVSAVLFSYTRAAWLALVAAGFCVVLAYGSRRWPRATWVGTALCLAIAFLLARNLRTDPAWQANASAHRTGITATARSFTNLRTDPSNMERMNRWSCAWRMFLDRPVVGHGPGTYQFAFFPYQRAEERTPISPPDTVWVNHMSRRVARGHSIILRPPVQEIGGIL